MNLNPSRIYSVNSRKFDGTIRRSWKCEFVSYDAEKIDLVGLFEQRVEHPNLGIIKVGTVSHERFYFNRWYNYFVFDQPDGTLRNHYINICMPPVVGVDSVDYIDLDIDLIVWPDGRWQTLDMEEFDSNRVEFGYPDDVADRALATLAELEDLVREASIEGVDTLLSNSSSAPARVAQVAHLMKLVDVSGYPPS